ncbi:hypothetical protein Bhyg_02870, partial [Pseudolycoriella hygida]
VTYHHYPENLKINPDELPEIERMISLGVNKLNLKADPMSDGKTIVPLKALHNIQTKIQDKIQNRYLGADELEQVLEKMQEIPNARVRVVTSDAKALIDCVISVNIRDSSKRESQRQNEVLLCNMSTIPRRVI